MVGKKIIVSKSKGGLGFRDLEAFNDAMLENPNSLCARLLKGRYYPIGDILTTGYPKEGSPTW